MNLRNNLSSLLIELHSSEKSSIMVEKNNTLVVKFSKDINKNKIKFIIEKIFKVKVKCIRTLLVKGKRKRYANNKYGFKNSWKKSYIKLDKNQDISFVTSSD